MCRDGNNESFFSNARKNTCRHQSVDIHTQCQCMWVKTIHCIHQQGLLATPCVAFPIGWRTTLQTNKANKSNKDRHRTAPSQSEDLVWMIILLHHCITLLHIPTKNMRSLSMPSAEVFVNWFSHTNIISVSGWKWHETQNSAGRCALPSWRCWGCLDRVWRRASHCVLQYYIWWTMLH